MDYVSAITILLLAIAFIVLAYLNLERMYYKGSLSKAETKAKYDSIYANVDYWNPKALYNTSFFLARRLVLAFVIVYAARSLVLQVMIADVLSTALLIYYIQVMPMMDKLSNWIQIFNEVAVLLCTWLIF